MEETLGKSKEGIKIMKILIVHPNFHVYGGAERLIVKLTNYLTEKNHNCTILTTIMIPEVRADLKEARLILCNSFQEMALWLDKIHKDFDVINYHNDPVELLSFGKKTPSVWLCNEPPQSYFDEGAISGAQKHVVKNFINKVIVADKNNQDRFKELYNIEADIVNYGVDYDFWQRGNDKFKEEYGISGPIISQVAWIHPMKNQLETLKIFNMVHMQIPETVLVLAGCETPYKQELEDYIFGHDLQANVIFTGFLPQEGVRGLYKASSVVLQPIKSQGGSLAVFDAMASGVPVVVSEEANCSSILEEHNFGYIHQEENLGITAGYIVKLLDGKEKQDVKKQKEFIKNLSWEKFGENMLNKFKEVLK
jgi:glycosyltransferase involved in cell wall biosynthesis